MKKQKKSAKTSIFGFILSIVLLGGFIFCFMDLYNYPEKYLSTWRYQLKLKIDSGDEAAIEYYNSNYVERGVYLYGEQDN